MGTLTNTHCSIKAVETKNYIIEKLIYAEINLSVVNSKPLTTGYSTNTVEIGCDYTSMHKYMHYLNKSAQVFTNGYNDTNKFRITIKNGQIIAKQIQPLSMQTDSIVLKACFKVSKYTPQNMKLGLKVGEI
ncbi:hypothetical protein LMB49_10850 [Limosilactobacillus reuteri]|uniref:hypothetical protein n=1 Tax=Limosilactobacillus reuteri TaxID=1598 RepID=UPI001E62F7EF|nr:hypothetical protein [Limosilactobacillus reuteri]MCC4370542.1 hypothetical protein [Limosilactobacillus reuteri]MCC4371889.1 hypothetical protein [Limosilactobacillus reuteri]MCC4509403.1 hypothetical protein [Limosilactobacillus reuteri]